MHITFNEQRFQKFLKFTQGFLKIFFVIVLFSIIVFTLATLTILFLPAHILTIDFGQISTLNFEVMNMQIEVPNTVFTETTMVRWPAFFIAIAGLAHVVFFGVFLRLLINILDDVSKQNPFSNDNVQRMFNMAMIIIAGAFILPIFFFVAGWQLVGTFTVEAQINYSVNSNMLITGILMLILASIFQYGHHLQTEVDMTV